MRKLVMSLTAGAVLCCPLLLVISGPTVSADQTAAARKPGQETQFTTPTGATFKIMRVSPDNTEVAAQINMQLPSGPVTIFEEDFDSLPNEAVMPDGWHIYDDDYDGETWSLSDLLPHEGSNCIRSVTNQSSPTGNWLVTPKVRVRTGGEQLHLYARHSGVEQPFEIWETETGYLPHDFQVHGDKIGEDTTTGDYTLYSFWANSGGYQWKDLYLAIRAGGTDPDAIYVDEITLPDADETLISFDGPIEFPPAGWWQSYETGMGYARWYHCDGTDTHPAGVTPHSGTHMAEFDSWNAFGPGESTRLILPTLDFSGYDNLYTLSFWMYHDDGLPDCDDNVKVQITCRGEVEETWETIYRYSETPHWEEYTYNLRWCAGDQGVVISLLAESWLGNGIYIDDVKITKEAGEATCYMIGGPGIFMDILDNFAPNWGPYTYFDPEYHCGSPYPYLMTGVHLTLGDPGDCIWPLDLDVVIREPNDYLEPCAEPGAELARYSLVADEAHFRYPEFGDLYLPEPFCITTPVFIGLEYTDGEYTAIPSIYFSNDYSPTPCIHWAYDALYDLFFEWNDFWSGSLGAPMFAVIGTEKSGDCQFEVFYYESGITPYPHPDSNVAWHQIWSEEDFCTSWHQDKIVGDTAGILEPTDKIYLSLLPDRITAKQVEILEIVHVLVYVDNSTSDTVYAHYRGVGDGDPYWQYPPVSTDYFWLVDWPYELHGLLLDVDGINDYGNGVLDAGDGIGFRDRLGSFISGTVFDVYTGIIARDVTPEFVCGDADANEIVNISDAVYLIAYIFGGGPPPDPSEAGDCDCNDIVNIADAVYLIAYIFGGGPAPCDGCS